MLCSYTHGSSIIFHSASSDRPCIRIERLPERDGDYVQLQHEDYPDVHSDHVGDLLVCIRYRSGAVLGLLRGEQCRLEVRDVPFLGRRQSWRTGAVELRQVQILRRTFRYLYAPPRFMALPLLLAVSPASTSIASFFDRKQFDHHRHSLKGT